ncbi:ROK family transcriptional regulator [Phytomonospora endophytica]|uniref:Putative NBD/HSP70 family sugar kinase n=1 Tax=Phytomonospora endophytica TaxID=714109 RepID=A0A841FU32_9ACTN|nr:ROK family transcriptional regulator [Phytomonospora endophytica]MBB6036847.1 putative NBD/HSP70 family sugar kinase [Phytomonospora endophytica]GIG68119.1 sugar kinase [Phytomonospora endophytica]
MTANRPAGSSRLLRTLNERAALGHLLERGTLTRGDLVTLTGLSKPTASEVIRRLEEAGLVGVAGRTQGGFGPRADRYAVNPDAAYAAAVAVGEPDRLDVAILDLTGRTRARTERTAVFGGDVTGPVAEAVAAACAAAGITTGDLRGVQLAVPGAYDPHTDTVSNIDVPGFGRPGLAGDLTERLGTTVAVGNDVNLAALAEREHRDTGDDGFALLWLGTRGVGLGIELGGTLLRGATGAAGEIGYLPVGPPGAATGDLQDLIGGPAIAALAAAHGHPAADAARAVAEAHGDTEFLTVLAERVLLALTAVIAVVDPALVVLAGEIGRAGGEALREAVTTALHRTTYRTRVEVTVVDGDPVLLGAHAAAASALREAVLATPT